MESLKQQVDGTHYMRLKMQPIELIHICGWNFFQGNIAKYVVRAPWKNGQVDINKAKHYCQLATDLKDTKWRKINRGNILEFCKANGFRKSFFDILTWINRKEYQRIIDALNDDEFVKKLYKTK